MQDRTPGARSNPTPLCASRTPGQTSSHSEPRTLLTLLGPEALAKPIRPLTEEEKHLAEEALACHGGDVIAALGGQRLPDAVKAEIRRLFDDDELGS